MVVVTGIRTAIKLAPIIYKASTIVYKGLKKTRSFDRYMARHPKILKYGTVGVGVGTLIYDLTNIDYDSLIGKNPTGNRFKQTRGYLQSPSTRFRGKANCTPYDRSRFCRQKQQYRSRYR